MAAQMVTKSPEAYRRLLSQDLPSEQVQALLAPAAFADQTAALSRLRGLALSAAAQAALVQILPRLLPALGASASPDRALLNLQRWSERLPDAAAFYASLAADERSLDLLVTLFAGSQFLSEILLRTPANVSLLADRAELSRQKGRTDFYVEAQFCLAPYLAAEAADATPSLQALHLYQKRELLRIGLGDLGGLLDLSSVTSQLAYLAESVIRACLAVACRRLGRSTGGFAVLGMGKLGGFELNYSSDIDLIFLAEEQGIHFQRLGQTLIELLSETTSEGFLYRVDMALRPWGRVGPLVPTRRGYLAYLKQSARLWEKQALLKARVVAGDDELGEAFLAASDSFLYSNNAETVRADVYAMKQRTEAWLRQTGHDWGEVKLGEGSIRDVEFVVQYLQLIYGGGHSELCSGNTLQALARLAEAEILTGGDYQVLTDGYLFLRTLEHYLQILDYQQTHALPANPGDLRYLAQRLGFSGHDGPARLMMRYQQHSAAVRVVYARHLAPPEAETITPAATGPLDNETGEQAMAQPSNPTQPMSAEPIPGDLEPAVRQHLARMTPAYTASFSLEEIKRHASLVARLSDDYPVEVRAEKAG